MLAGLALGLALATPARSEPATASGRDACAPVRAQPDPLPDLQQLAEAICRALWPDALPSDAAERWRLRIGGWIDGSYRDTDSSGGDDSIALNHANLHVDVRLDDRWQLFFEGEYEYEPALIEESDEREWSDERGWELEQLYGEYRYADFLRARGGRFSTPFGYWTPVHWSINVDTIEAPLYEENRIVPEQQIGLRVFGSIFSDRIRELQTEIEYSLYGGYGEDGWATGKPDGLTLGTDLRLRLEDRHMLGVSLYTQENGDEDDRRENNLMIYAETRLPFDLLLRSEYVRQHRNRTRPGYVHNADLFYAKLRWDFLERAYLNYRFEYGEDDRLGETVDHVAHRFTLGVQPIARIRLKAEYARHILEEGPLGDYDFWGISAGLFF